VIHRAWRAVLADGWLVLHFATCAIPAWFALVLSLPGNTFEASASSYSHLAAITTEHTFAMVSCVVAVFSAMAWFINGPWVWLASCVMLSGWHGALAALIWTANPLGTGGGTYAVLATTAFVKLCRPLVHASPHR
jgi:uncharacterized membrane protein YbaN (DUF454 family)